jgi:molecular chaperone DnaK (HSP70)
MYSPSTHLLSWAVLVLLLPRQTLDQLNELSTPLLAKLEAPLRSALARSGLPMSSIAAVEIVGGGMRPRCVKRCVAEVLGLPGFDDHTTGYGLRCVLTWPHGAPTSSSPLFVRALSRGCIVCICGLFQHASTTMNMDEAVAKGCAFTCAMLSPLFQVKEVQVTEYVLYPIKVSWDIKGASTSNDAMDDGEPEESKDSGNTLVVFEAGKTYPSTKAITFKSAEVCRDPASAACVPVLCVCIASRVSWSVPIRAVPPAVHHYCRL